MRHEISSSGYTCNLSLSKNDHESRSVSKSKLSGKAPKESSNTTNTAKTVSEVKTQKSSKPQKITVNLN